jgi:MFS family permease
MGFRRALDGLNFCLADVRDGLGPFLAIYLLSVQHWDEARIGMVMSVAGIAGLLARTPMGAWVDATEHKRTLVIGAALVVAAACILMPLVPNFAWLVGWQTVVGVADSVFPPAIAAITLGLAGPRAFAAHTGRNEAFNHAGNAAAAILAGAVGYMIGPIAVFWEVAAMALLSIVAVSMIPGNAIDNAVARGLPEREVDAEHAPSKLQAVLYCRPLLIFAACVTLFHLANAAMLPLVGQRLALANSGEGMLSMSACIIVAQMVMVPMAILVSRKADDWGRKRLFLIGFAALPIRGVLYTLSSDPYYLVAIQALDGIGAGIFGALFPVVIADLTKGTGRYNVSAGAVSTAQGVGASLSTTVAGLIVVSANYNTAFLALAAIALLALILFAVAMPETGSASAATGRALPRHEAA